MFGSGFKIRHMMLDVHFLSLCRENYCPQDTSRPRGALSALPGIHASEALPSTSTSHAPSCHFSSYFNNQMLDVAATGSLSTPHLQAIRTQRA